MKDLDTLQKDLKEVTRRHMHDMNVMNIVWEYACENELSEIESILEILIDRAKDTRDRLENIEVDLREVVATA